METRTYLRLGRQADRQAGGEWRRIKITSGDQQCSHETDISPFSTDTPGITIQFVAGLLAPIAQI